MTMEQLWERRLEMTTEQLQEANQAAQVFIQKMSGQEAGIFTLRKAFEMGYLSALSKLNKSNGE